MALLELQIRNFAVIKSAHVEFDRGFTVVSGETGAGKSILIDALNLVLGARADSALVRHGESNSEISALFDLSELPLVKAWLEKNDLQHPDDVHQLLIRRHLKEQGPTKCYINDRMTTLSSLKEVGLMLVDIHGQHEHQSLLRKSTHREIVDQKAGVITETAQLRDIARNVNRLRAELQTLSSVAGSNHDRLEFLRFQLSELEEARLVEGEFEELEQEFHRLSNADFLKSSIEKTLEALHEGEPFNVSSLLGAQVQQLEKISTIDKTVNSALDLVTSALAQVDEAQAELRAALGKIDGDPERFSEIDARRDLLINLARKHRCNESELLTRQSNIEAEIEELDQENSAPERLQQEIHALEEQYNALAKTVSTKRRIAANNLSEAITEQMQDLGMQGGRLHVAIDSLSQTPAELSLFGTDDIEFLVSTNAGMPLKPLNKTASGGELSRISLAIQVIASQHSKAPTLVFDEVDVGVGGGIAQIVGERLKVLGTTAQVICITHLPQVAALGQQHILVEKITRSDQTFTELAVLDETRRLDELSRMLGGVQITETTRTHARELLNTNAN